MKELSRCGFTLIATVALAILLSGAVGAQTQNPTLAGPVAITSFGLTPKPMPPWFKFLPKPVIST